MTILNLALTFPQLHAEAFLNFSQYLNSTMTSDFVLSEDSIPHLTILQFDAHPQELPWSALAKLLKCPLPLSLAGLLFLPSKEGHLWIEISVLKSAALSELQREATSIVGDRRIHSGVGDHFRPHITVARATNTRTIPAMKIDDEVVRRKDVVGNLTLGISGSNFQFERKIHTTSLD